MGYKAGVDCDIVLTISSVEYPCMLDSPRGLTKQDINEFAARVTTGPPTYSDDDIYSVVWQENWRHGLGFPEYSDEFGYAYTGDHVDTRRQGVVQLATKLTSVDASGELVNAFIDYVTDVSAGETIAACGATDKGIRWTSDGTSWSAKTDLDDSGTAREIYDFVDAGGYLFASQDTDRLQKMATGNDPSLDASWTNAGSDGNPPNDFKWLAKGGGYLWGSEEGKNFLHIAAEADGSDFEGDGETDAACIVVGAEDTAITALCWWNSNMYVGKEDALYMINTEADAAYKVGADVPYKWSGNFENMCVGSDGGLYFIAYDKVFRWLGRTPIDITPGGWGAFPGATFGVHFPGSSRPSSKGYASGTKPPYVSYSEFRSMARVGNDIVVAGKTTDAPAEWHMLYWTGSGWHKLYTLITSNTYVPYAVYRSYKTSRTYISLGAATTATHVIRHRGGSDLPYDDYPTSGNHYIYFSKFSLGLLDIPKYLKGSKLRSFNLNTTQTIAWAYQLDDNDSWYTLGTQNTTPYQAIDFSSTATCKTMQLRADLTTSTGAQTPYLDAFAIKMLARPATVYGYAATLRVGDKVQLRGGRTQYTPTGRELMAALEVARAATAPITLNTPLESSVTCFVTAYARVGVFYDKEERPYEVIQISLTAA